MNRKTVVIVAISLVAAGIAICVIAGLLPTGAIAGAAIAPTAALLAAGREKRSREAAERARKAGIMAREAAQREVKSHAENAADVKKSVREMIR